MVFLYVAVLYMVLIQSESKPPNIIFFLVDDLGYDDLGFQDNNQIHTPNINNLRQKSQFLEWYYGEPLCTPTRSTIMTGTLPLHTGINTVIQPTFGVGVPLQFKFLPKVLHQNGYETHCVGKWHLGFYKWSYTPTYRGFESFYGYFTGETDYYTHRRDGYYDFMELNGIECGKNCYKPAVAANGIYSAFAFANRSIEIIKNHSHSSSDEPLFLYIPWQSVHAPCQVPINYVSPYNKSINDTKRRNFAGMLSVLDEGIGNITEALQDYGYMDDDGNTLIIFSSDNGAPVGQCGGYNYPLKGSKSTIWEGGTRLTAFIYGTADLVPISLRGTNYTQLMHTVDWYSTLLDAAGIDINASINHTVDSLSHWKGIIGDASVIGSDKYFTFRDEIWYGYDTAHGLFVDYVNVGYRYKWNKLINGSGGNAGGHKPPPNMVSTNEVYPLLFDLNIDPFEYNNVTKNNSELVTQLQQMMFVIEKDGVPQLENDTNCPAIIHPNNSDVGKLWVPWCG